MRIKNKSLKINKNIVDEKIGINSLIVNQIQPDYLSRYNNDLQVNKKSDNDNLIIHHPSFEFKHRILSAILKHLDSGRIKCAFDVDIDLWASRLNRKTITTILENVFINSIEAIKKSGNIKLSVKNLNKENDDNWFFRYDRYIEVAIIDDGAGISKENLSKIFIPFFSTKRNHIGMGLNIVQKLLQLNEGFMKIYSDENEGTFCKIYLPVSF